MFFGYIFFEYTLLNPSSLKIEMLFGRHYWIMVTKILSLITTVITKAFIAVHFEVQADVSRKHFQKWKNELSTQRKHKIQMNSVSGNRFVSNKHTAVFVVTCFIALNICICWVSKIQDFNKYLKSTALTYSHISCFTRAIIFQV